MSKELDEILGKPAPAYEVFWWKIKSLFTDKQCNHLYHNGKVEMCCVKKEFHFGKCKDYYGNWDHKQKVWMRF